MKEKHLWTVYILRGSDTSLYTGITTDLDRRLHEHNHSNKGAKSLRGKRPVKLAWFTTQEDRSQATKLEIHIKSLSKKAKESLVNGLSSLKKLGLQP